MNILRTLHFHLVTIMPEMFSALRYDGVIGRALAQGLITLQCWNPRDYAANPQHKVDDRPYGGGGGMILMVQPLFDCLQDIGRQGTIGQLIYLTPQGIKMNQQLINVLANMNYNMDHNNSNNQTKTFTLVAGRYEGFDERIFTLYPGLELSIGDFVVSGGELPAMLLIDAIARQLPGVVGNLASVQADSFMSNLLDYPQYTRPREFAGQCVPKILLGGHHQQIQQWRQTQSLQRTAQRRPDLLDKITAKNIA